MYTIFDNQSELGILLYAHTSNSIGSRHMTASTSFFSSSLPPLSFSSFYNRFFRQPVTGIQIDWVNVLTITPALHT